MIQLFIYNKLFLIEPQIILVVLDNVVIYHVYLNRNINWSRIYKNVWLKPWIMFIAFYYFFSTIRHFLIVYWSKFKLENLYPKSKVKGNCFLTTIYFIFLIHFEFRF